jgi:hypothetical protein
MVNEKDYNELIEKVDKITKEKKIDLSSDEDLSIGIMNLIGIEEHLFFTAQKTGNDAYFEILNEVREMRKQLLKKIIKEYEGEVWCISKHLLSASMRLMEVGTKELTKGNKEEAKEMFEKSYDLYSLFWGLNLKLVDSKTVKDKHIVSEEDINDVKAEEKGGKSKKVSENSKDETSSTKNSKFFGKMKEAFKKAIDCCKE